MAMSVTATETKHASVKKVVFAWVSAADGSASGSTTYAYSGEIIGLTTIPGAAGLAPTDDYDVTLTDVGGHDVLLGAGANRDTANTEHVVRANLACVADSKLTLNIANAGDSNAGQVVVYIS